MFSRHPGWNTSDIFVNSEVVGEETRRNDKGQIVAIPIGRQAAG